MVSPTATMVVKDAVPPSLPCAANSSRNQAPPNGSVLIQKTGSSKPGASPPEHRDGRAERSLPWYCHGVAQEVTTLPRMRIESSCFMSSRARRPEGQLVLWSGRGGGGESGREDASGGDGGQRLQFQKAVGSVREPGA